MSVHAFEGGLTPGPIGVDNNLRVAAGPEPVTERHQLLAQLDVVEDFAIEHDPRRAAGIRERLLAARKVDDGQAGMCQSRPFVPVQTPLIRAAMGQRADHAYQRFARGWR